MKRLSILFRKHPIVFIFVLILGILVLKQILFYFYTRYQVQHEAHDIEKKIQSLDLRNSVSAEQDGIRLVVNPKEAENGDVVDVYVINDPSQERFFRGYYIDHLGFADSKKQYGRNEEINKLFNAHPSSYVLKDLPRFFHFQYKLPSKTYSQEFVKGTVSYYKDIEHDAAKGQGIVYIHYDPTQEKDFFDTIFGSGEGYQGDGFSISVSFSLK